MRSGAASETAQRVAAHRLTFDRAAAPYADGAADELLARDVAGKVRVSDGPMRSYLAARTMFFDRVVVAALERGVSQVVIGAAGYDGRALRYRKPGVAWFELDHPDTQADKRERLVRLGIDTEHVRFAAADFAVDSVTDALTAAGLDRSRPSVFLLEGVVVYLDRSVVESVLRQLRAVAGDGSRLAVSLSVGSGGAARVARRGAFQAAVAAMGEPATTYIPPEEVDELFSSTGWRVLPPTSERAATAGLRMAETGPVPA